MNKKIDVEICPYCEDRSIKELVNRGVFFDSLWCHVCEGRYKIVYKRVPIDIVSDSGRNNEKEGYIPPKPEPLEPRSLGEGFELLPQKYESTEINVTLINKGYVPNTLNFEGEDK